MILKLNTNSTANVTDLHPDFVRKLNLFAKYEPEIAKKIMVIWGKRSDKQQAELFAQGRTKKGNIATYADGSKGNESNHQFGKAVDFMPLDENGVPTWNVPKSFYKEVADKALKYGIQSSYYWENNPNGDLAHLEDDPTRSYQDILNSLNLSKKMTTREPDYTLWPKKLESIYLDKDQENKINHFLLRCEMADVEVKLKGNQPIVNSEFAKSIFKTIDFDPIWESVKHGYVAPQEEQGWGSLNGLVGIYHASEKIIERSLNNKDKDGISYYEVIFDSARTIEQIIINQIHQCFNGQNYKIANTKKFHTCDDKCKCENTNVNETEKS